MKSSVANVPLAIFFILSVACLPLASAFGFSTEGTSDFGYDTEDEVSTITNNIYTGNLTNLSQLEDNNLPAPNDDEVLTWDDATNMWIAQAPSGVGNPFDQDLNTTDNVEFQNLTLGQQIIFAFGETIDNIIDGWIRITGGLNVTNELHIGSDSYFNGTLYPSSSLTHDIGSGANRWRWLYVQNISAEHIDTYSLTATENITAGDFILGDGSFLNNVNVTDIWVNESGDTMTGNLNMSLNDINGVGRMTLKEDGSIWFGSANARIYSGGTNYVFIDASDTIELRSSNEIIFRADNDLNDLHVFGVTDYGAIDTPYFGTLYSDMELRPGTGTVNVIGNLTTTAEVGIGTSSPIALLHVQGSSYFHQNIFMNQTNGGYWLNSFDVYTHGFYRNADGDLFLRATSDRMFINGTSGNVGIGTSSPSSKLNVYSVDNPSTKYLVNITNLDPNAHDSYGLLVRGGALSSLSKILDIQDSSGNSEFIVKGDGNVGIGTSSPDSNLEISDFGTNSQTIQYVTTYNDQAAYTPVYIFRKSHTDTDGSKVATIDTEILGSLRFQGVDSGSDFDYGAYIEAVQNGAAGTTVPTDLYFKTADGTNAVANRMVITKDGNVGIGTTTPQQELNVIGNGNFTGNVTAENVFLHSHLFTYTNVSLTVPGAGSWVNITFDKNVAPIKERITHTYNDATNDTFTIIDSGEYKIYMSLVAIDSSATPDSQVEYRILKNNVEVAGSGRAIDIDRQDYDRSKDSFAIVDFSSGDEINFQFTSDSTTAGISSNCLYLDTCPSAVISIERAA